MPFNFEEVLDQPKVKFKIKEVKLDYSSGKQSNELNTFQNRNEQEYRQINKVMNRI